MISIELYVPMLRNLETTTIQQTLLVDLIECTLNATSNERKKAKRKKKRNERQKKERIQLIRPNKLVER